MAVFGLEKKTMTISLPMATFRSLCETANRQGKTPTQYVRSLVITHLAQQGLPVYYDINRESEK